MLKFLTYFQTRGDAEHSHFHIKSMKNPRRFTQINRVLRFGSGVALISAAAAMAFVAVKNPNPSLTASSTNRSQAINKFRGDPDELGGNKRTMPGLDKDLGPLSAA